jgi:FMN phosphatase YigB (HAD superfamily)
MAKGTVLLDLDGTLLPVEIDDFLRDYFGLITREFSDAFSGQELINNIMTATNKMIENDGEKFNNEVFMENFFKLVEAEDPADIMNRFDAFYLEVFPKLGSTITSRGLSKDLIKILKESGWRLVLATNPIFPEEAIRERVRWIDIDPDDFFFITSYENMHYCKPNIEYYQEIVGLLNLNPQDCIMIGNDIQEDMIAGQLGMKTYLVTDFLLDHGLEIPRCDWKGTMEELVGHFKSA